MKTFLIQTIDGEIQHDFSFHLKEAVKFQNWYHNEELYKIIKSSNPNVENCIPVGSLEFVAEYMEKFHKIEKRNIKPINVPLDLQKENYLKRNYIISNKNEYQITKPTFVKSVDKYKSFTKIINNQNELPNGDFIFSEVIEIESEWRCFIFNGELVGLNHYTGDFTLFPDIEVIKKMVASYKNAPNSFTLDIGITKEKNYNNYATIIIEVHPFVSCGLYGFKKYNILPQMFIAGFNFFLSQAKP